MSKPKFEGKIINGKGWGQLVKIEQFVCECGNNERYTNNKTLSQGDKIKCDECGREYKPEIDKIIKRCMRKVRGKNRECPICGGSLIEHEPDSRYYCSDCDKELVVEDGLRLIVKEKTRQKETSDIK